MYRIRKYNQFTLVILMTSFAVLLTLLLAYLFYEISDEKFRHVDLVLAITALLIIAPIATWWLFGLLLKLDYLEVKMRNLANYDELTTLLTRRAFFEHANQYLSLAHRNRSKFGLLMVDLDHFKQINDKYGHPVGDNVLQVFGEIVNRIKRESDLVGRYGGEEFIFVLPDTDASGIIQYTEKLHSKVREAFLESFGEIINFTISIGVVLSNDQNNTYEIRTLVNKADHALYDAKITGRNKTIIYGANNIFQRTCALTR